MWETIGGLAVLAVVYGLYRYAKARKEKAAQRVIVPNQPLGDRNETDRGRRTQ